MMNRALWTAATGMHAQQTNVDVIAHDLTNVNTNGYKKTTVTFADLFYQRLRAAGIQGRGLNNLPVGIQVGNGVRVTGTTKVFTKGAMIETGNPFNIMINDDGNLARNFFCVDIGGGQIRYTRDGSFQLDADGNLVLSNGAILQGGITVPANAQDPTVTETGVVQYKDETGTTQDAGQLDLATFVNPAGLEPEGDNLFQETPASGPAQAGKPGDAGFATVIGGALELSNVSAIEEIVKLISAQRAYEFNSRTIQTSDEMLQTVNNLKR
ncbi:MAG: flagellar basal-body rod protein FlgG [Planctomycetota bacterium]